MTSYPLLDLHIGTPPLELRGATDELLDNSQTWCEQDTRRPPTYDDPMSFYEPDPDLRVPQVALGDLARQRQGRGRCRCLAALLRGCRGWSTCVDTGPHRGSFSTFGTLTSFSWLPADQRGQGTGVRCERREATLHLAFEGLGAKEASSDAFVDNHGSNAITRDLGGNQTGRTWLHHTASPHF